ncbi:MAG TPA: cytochrome b/b6 domain-containing protein [Dehalococcoidia bacterium]|nr:cytochrome b/b6 domain-containing protein [Dehalococcoidia bacterium]
MARQQAVLRGAARAGARTAEAYVVRFDVHQRIQHSLMMSSFIVLALTGLPQKFSDLGASQWWVSTLGGLETVRMIHRGAALVMLTDCVYHLAYLCYRIAVQRRFECFRMVPTPRDVRDMARMIQYFLGLSREKPKFDRFTYLEKFDYWAVFWGIAMIGGSGLMLMFPVYASGLLPGQTIAVALTVHGDEAILAAGWILIMHVFNVHLAPWSFPFNPAIFTGKMRAHRYAEDHPLEWERLQAASSSSAPPATHPPLWLTATARTKAGARAMGRAAAGLAEVVVAWLRRIIASLARRSPL